MHHTIMLVLATTWVAANIFLWSLKQSHLALLWQSVGMAAIAYPAFYFYVTRRN
jgi:hypothetical protein